MATFSAAGSVSGYDFRQFNLARLDTTEVISASSSLIRSQVVPNQYLDLTGSFVYDGAGDLIGNTLSGYSEVMNGITLWSFSGLTMSVYNFAYYYVYNDNTGFLTEAMAGNDTITGSGFNDYLMGFAGADVINAGNGDDWLDGGAGADTLNGGNGNDTYLSDGLDTINDSGSSSGDLIIATGTVDLSTMTGIENVQLASSYVMSVTGSGADNILWGNSYGSSFSGGGGNDTIYGYGGDDTLIGGTGDDRLYGGFGNDTYGIDSVSDAILENHLQILWRNKLTGENYLWDSDGANVAINGYLSIAYVPLGWEIVGTSDFNGDGTDDILWRNSQTGQNHLWHMTASGAFGQDLSRSVIPLEWKVVATADFDGDGKSDILWRNSRTGENHLWHMNDTNSVNGVNLSRAVIPLEWDVVGAADFDNDGHVDILWRNSRTGENHLWYMNDGTFLAGVNLSVPVIPVEWKIETLRDFNDDGHVDILWRNSRTGENHLWYMNDSTVLGGYNLSIAAVSVDWEIVGTLEQDSWGGSDTVQSSLANYTLPERLENLTLSGTSNINGTGNEVANQITGNSGDNVLYGLAGNDTIDGGIGTDTIYGGDGNDTLRGNGTLNGDAGNDSIYGRAGDDTLNGGDGDDRVMDYDGGADTMNGGAGNDLIDSGSGDDILDGGDGDDIIAEFTGNDTLNGGAGNDTLHAGVGNDIIYGGVGNDTINGDYGNDIISGDDGNDTITDMYDTNTIDGGVGSDNITSGSGADTIYGGDGNDTITDMNGTNTIDSGAGDDNITGGLGADTIQAGDGNDVIYDQDGSDIIDGGDGNDTINATFGSDVVTGGAGNDRILGGPGSDTLTGGTGSDTFVWGIDDTGVDHITDFQAGAGGDTINIAAQYFFVIFSGQAVTASNIGDYVQVSSGAGSSTVYVDADGAQTGMSFNPILVLDGVTGLNLSDLYTNGNLTIS